MSALAQKLYIRTATSPTMFVQHTHTHTHTHARARARARTLLHQQQTDMQLWVPSLMFRVMESRTCPSCWETKQFNRSWKSSASCLGMCVEDGSPLPLRSVEVLAGFWGPLKAPKGAVWGNGWIHRVIVFPPSSPVPPPAPRWLYCICKVTILNSIRHYTSTTSLIKTRDSNLSSITPAPPLLKFIGLYVELQLHFVDTVAFKWRTPSLESRGSTWIDGMCLPAIWILWRTCQLYLSRRFRQQRIKRRWFTPNRSSSCRTAYVWHFALLTTMCCSLI